MTLLRAALILAVLTSGAGWAQEPAAPDNSSTAAPVGGGAPAADIKKPWDFAPSEQIIAGRDTMDFRKEGTLLSKMTREIPTVDVASLAERKLAMYDGNRYYRGPLRDAAAKAAAIELPAGRRPASSDEEWTVRFGWLGWTLLGILVVGILIAWRLGWFVPFSARDRRQRASQAASAARRSRAAKKLGPLIAPAKRDE